MSPMRLYPLQKKDIIIVKTNLQFYLNKNQKGIQLD